MIYKTLIKAMCDLLNKSLSRSHFKNPKLKSPPLDMLPHIKYYGTYMCTAVKWRLKCVQKLHTYKLLVIHISTLDITVSI